MAEGDPPTDRPDLVETSLTIESHHTVEYLYERVLKLDSDMRHELPILHELAKECRHITEIGVRGGLSTIALLAACPESLVSWDIELQWIARICLLQHLRDSEPPPGRWRTKFQPRCGDSTKVITEGTDLLVIDSLHTFEQLRRELKKHGNQSRRYVAIHDTSPKTFGYKSEDGSEPGLRAAIREFQEKWYPRWQLVYQHDHGSGLTVLQRHHGFGMFWNSEAFAGGLPNED